MVYRRDKKILKLFLIVGVLILPFSFIKRPRKEWLIVFFLKGFIASIIGKFVIAQKRIKYPIRLLPKVYKTSFLFEYLLFPLACIWYNQTTYSSKLKGIFVQCFFHYSLPITILEFWLERTTRLIKYKKWTVWHTYFSLSFTFLFTRGFMSIVRKISKSNESY